METMFKGKTVIITGATSRIGRALAERLAYRGANIMLASAHEEGLKSLVQDLNAKTSDEGFSDKISHFNCDISQKFGVNNLISATISAFDHIDSLITTTIDFEKGDLLNQKVDVLDRIFASNLRSTFLLTQLAAQKMLAQTKQSEEPQANGSIVHISALSGIVSSPEVAAHAISCAGLQQLTRSFASALAPHGIRVNGVAPGGVMTDTLKDSIAATPDLRAALIGRTPLGRIGEPGEAAEAALFLASDRASFITGQTLIVDGGRSVLDPLAAANI